MKVPWKKLGKTILRLSRKFAVQFKILFVLADKFGFTFVIAVGKSKKLAKRNAAQAMIQRILQGGVTPQVQPDVSEEFDEETIPLVIAPPFFTLCVTVVGSSLIAVENFS